MNMPYNIINSQFSLTSFIIHIFLMHVHVINYCKSLSCHYKAANLAKCMLIRELLRERLRLLGTPGCWDHLTQQGGLYCFIGLNGE